MRGGGIAGRSGWGTTRELVEREGLLCWATRAGKNRLNEKRTDVFHRSSFKNPPTAKSACYFGAAPTIHAFPAGGTMNHTAGAAHLQ